MGLWVVAILALLTCQASAMSLERRQIEGTLRLVGGRDNTQGRLEIFHNGQWGTICDDRFDSLAATVACRDLGQVGGQKIQSWQFGPSNGPIWMSEVVCRGTEGRITQCKFTGWGNTQCGTHENVGLRCGFGAANSFRPATSGSRYSGSQYGTGSGSRYNSAGNRYHSSSSSSHNTHYTYSNTNRGGGAVARPVVPADRFQPAVETEGSIRLLDGKNPTQGRLEIFHNKKWGTVCKDGFDDLDATVVCRQLGLDGGMAKPPTWFGAGLGEIWLSRALCDGREKRLTDCPYTGWGIKDCHHTEDVGVECFSSRTVNY